MRKNFGTKTWLYPMPVFIVAAYDENGVPNAMNAAWGGIYTDNEVGICLAEGHKTTQNILATKAFTVSMGTAEFVTACDYVGIVSGNKEPDKLQKAGFHTQGTADDTGMRTPLVRSGNLPAGRKHRQCISFRRNPG